MRQKFFQKSGRPSEQSAKVQFDFSSQRLNWRSVQRPLVDGAPLCELTLNSTEEKKTKKTVKPEF